MIREIKRLRFSADDDLVLLREFISQNPLVENEKWEAVQQHVHEITGKKFLIRTLKDHLQLLIEMWRNKDSKNKTRSGVEEIYSEKDNLLQEICDMCQDTNFIIKKKRNKFVSKEKQIAELGQKVRELYANNLLSEKTENSNSHISFLNEHDYVSHQSDVTSSLLQPAEEIVVENTTEEHSEPIVSNTIAHVKEKAISTPSTAKIIGPQRTRCNKSVALKRNALEYLHNKEEREATIKRKQLELEEKRLNLDERKIQIEEQRLDMELEERKNIFEMDKERFKLEVEQRKQTAQLIESQQKLIDLLTNKLEKYENNKK